MFEIPHSYGLQVYSGNAGNVQYQVYEDKLYLTKPELDLHNHPIIIS